MKKIPVFYLAVVLFLLSPNLTAQQGWVPVHIDSADAVNSIVFTDTLNGWAAGHAVFQGAGVTLGCIFHTTDGGQSWNFQTFNDFGIQWLWFINGQTGWCLFPSDIGDYMAETTNGGAEWFGWQYMGYTRGFSFVDANTGWVLKAPFGVSPSVWRSTDGGTSWDSLSSIPSANRIHFVTTSVGAVGTSTGAIYRSTNGGVSWHPQVSGTTRPMTKIFFKDLYHGWAVGDSGDVLRTTDGGSHWSVQNVDGIPFKDVMFVDTLQGWAVGSGGSILTTTDGGVTWSYQTSHTTVNLYGVSFVDAQHGWAGGGGWVLRTTTGGVSGIRSVQQPGLHPFALSQNYPNPFNLSTTIAFDIPAAAEVSLAIYNVFGERIATLVHGPLAAGTHYAVWNADRASSGVYFIRLQALGRAQTKKLLLLK